MPRVVVVGAGFAGLSAARALAGKPVDVVVVDQHNFHTFLPLLYQVATAGLDPSDVAYPVRAVFGRHGNVTFRHGKVTAVDLAERTLSLADGTSLHYDHLVVATGAAAAFFSVPGAAEHSRPLYTLADARRLRNHLLSTLEMADARPELFDGAAPVFVVVGGGPTGVETAGALVELLEVSLKRDRLRIDPVRTRVVLVDMADKLLTAFRSEAGSYAASTLRGRGVEVRLGAGVAEVAPKGVRLTNGDWIDADAVVWAGGVTVDGTLAGSMDTPHGRGSRVTVEPDLSLEGHPEVSVVGDAAAVPLRPGSDETCAQLAQVAIQSGKHAARQVVARIDGRPTRPFRYRDKGIMATIGRRAAVAQLRVGPVVVGTLGWLMWLGLHLVYLIGFRNRAAVILNWTWRYFRWPSGPRVIVDDG